MYITFYDNYCFLFSRKLNYILIICVTLYQKYEDIYVSQKSRVVETWNMLENISNMFNKWFCICLKLDFLKIKVTEPFIFNFL